jgi:hypothetical protein
MSAWLDRLVVLALLGALLLGLRQRLDPASGALLLPLLRPGAGADALMGPGAETRAVAAEAAAVGELLTIEDLIRACWALSARPEGLPGAPPLSAEERAALLPLVERADQQRRALLAVEAELAAAEGRLGAAAAAAAGGLDPAQRALIMNERDQISVGGVEEAYYGEARAKLEGTP